MALKILPILAPSHGVGLKYRPIPLQGGKTHAGRSGEGQGKSALYTSKTFIYYYYYYYSFGVDFVVYSYNIVLYIKIISIIYSLYKMVALTFFFVNFLFCCYSMIWLIFRVIINFVSFKKKNH